MRKFLPLPPSWSAVFLMVMQFLQRPSNLRLIYPDGDAGCAAASSARGAEDAARVVLQLPLGRGRLAVVLELLARPRSCWRWMCTRGGRGWTSRSGIG